MAMSGKYLLDTNIIIALFANESAVLDYLSNADEVFVSMIAIGELWFGALKSQNVESNLSRIDEFAANCPILICDGDTARHYGRLKNSLRLKGRLLPENDIWIAAVAEQYGLVLASLDSHFREIDDLPLAIW